MLWEKIEEVGSPFFHIYNVFFLTIFTGIITFLMLLVYYLTYQPSNPLKDIEDMLGKDRVKYNIRQSNIKKTDLLYLPKGEREELEAYFNKPSLLRFYVSDVITGNPVMTVFSVSSGGFGGLIKALVGTDGKTVLSLKILDVSTETPGLGQRVSEKSFQRQFLGKTREELPMDRLSWTNIDIISGASFSSNAVVNNINKAFDLYLVEEVK